jgi:hypothetical protein
MRWSVNGSPRTSQHIPPQARGHRAMGTPQRRGTRQRPPGASKCLGLVIAQGYPDEPPFSNLPPQRYSCEGFSPGFAHPSCPNPGVIVPWGRYSGGGLGIVPQERRSVLGLVIDWGRGPAAPHPFGMPGRYSLFPSGCPGDTPSFLQDHRAMRPILSPPPRCDGL